MPAAKAFVREITGPDYEAAALVIPGDDPELADAALAALLGGPGAMAPCIRAGPMPDQRCRPAGRPTT